MLNCTLKRSPEPSNTEALAREVIGELQRHGVDTERVRVVDLNILPGVTSNEGPGACDGTLRNHAARSLSHSASPGSRWPAFTGWLEGKLVDRHAVGIDEGADLDAPNSLSAPRQGATRGLGVSQCGPGRRHARRPRLRRHSYSGGPSAWSPSADAASAEAS